MNDVSIYNVKIMYLYYNYTMLHNIINIMRIVTMLLDEFHPRIFFLLPSNYYVSSN